MSTYINKRRLASNTGKQKLYACFLDLRRAAVSFFLKPHGEAHKELLTHTLKTLDQIPNKNLSKYKKKISEFKKITSRNSFSQKEKMKIADDILTTGILLKQN